MNRLESYSAETGSKTGSGTGSGAIGSTQAMSQMNRQPDDGGGGGQPQQACGIAVTETAKMARKVAKIAKKFIVIFNVFRLNSKIESMQLMKFLEINPHLYSFLP